jgi:hypothetical protein
MSSSCCGGSSKSEPNKVAATLATQATAPAAEKPAENKSECCKDTPAKSEKSGCCC